MKRVTPSKKPRLPSFIAPMLAKAGTAFDSEEYLFEVKWDGTLLWPSLKTSTVTLLNRRKANMTERYPEFAFLKDVARRDDPGRGDHRAQRREARLRVADVTRAGPFTAEDPAPGAVNARDLHGV